MKNQTLIFIFLTPLVIQWAKPNQSTVTSKKTLLVTTQKSADMYDQWGTYCESIPAIGKYLAKICYQKAVQNSSFMGEYHLVNLNSDPQKKIQGYKKLLSKDATNISNVLVAYKGEQYCQGLMKKYTKKGIFQKIEFYTNEKKYFTQERTRITQQIKETQIEEYKSFLTKNSKNVNVSDLLMASNGELLCKGLISIQNDAEKTEKYHEIKEYFAQEQTRIFRQLQKQEPTAR